MIPKKVKEHIDEYLSQEIYVQIAIIKGKHKISTNTAIEKYLDTNHFKDLSEGKPYYHFIKGLRDKCLIKLKNSPMQHKHTNDKTINLLQKKLNNLSDVELEDTFWEIETGEFFSGNQVKELENECLNLMKKLNISISNKNLALNIIMNFCEDYEYLCQKKYPEAMLPLEILKTKGLAP
tara:strand:- start:128 stop:664 length:537 start_codon:yes stop_codon:yes gene_type:complete